MISERLHRNICSDKFCIRAQTLIPALPQQKSVDKAQVRVFHRCQTVSGSTTPQRLLDMSARAQAKKWISLSRSWHKLSYRSHGEMLSKMHSQITKVDHKDEADAAEMNEYIH